MSTDLGSFAKTQKPTTRREYWSTAQAIHQQKGQICGIANGNHAVQNPAAVGARVRSICQLSRARDNWHCSACRIIPRRGRPVAREASEGFEWSLVDAG